MSSVETWDALNKRASFKLVLLNKEDEAAKLLICCLELKKAIKDAEAWQRSFGVPRSAFMNGPLCLLR